tara:strand:- start:33 stop:221 length:189 start_codon:yes stop_codon:yes gene_type:complete
METFNKILSDTHDWALNRIGILCEGDDQSQKNASAIKSEFKEWIGSTEDELDILSMDYLDDF